MKEYLKTFMEVKMFGLKIVKEKEVEIDVNALLDEVIELRKKVGRCIKQSFYPNQTFLVGFGPGPELDNSYPIWQIRNCLLTTGGNSAIMCITFNQSYFGG